MRLNNVFYGFTKDGERKLLVKRYKTESTSLGDVVRTVYYDLEENKYFESNEIDFNTLIPIVKMVGNYKRKSKRKVIKAYKADNNLLFDVTGAFYGDIVEKTTYYDLKTRNGYFMGSARANLYDEVLIPQSENILFARIDDPKGRVQDVKKGNLYPWSDRILKGVSVKEVRPIKKEIFEETVVTKKKLLEADYKKEL